MGNQVIMAPGRGRSNFLRILDAVAGMTGLPNGEAVLNTYKVFDDPLKLPMRLVPNQSSYAFNIMKSAELNVPGANQIDMNDLFCITGVGLRFTRADYASTNQTLSNYGNYPEYTYPYTQVFTGTGSGKSEAACLQTIVRGKLALSIVNDQQWSIPCSELVFENVNYTGGDFTPTFGGSIGQRGIFELDDIVIASGFNDNILNLTLLTGDTALIDGSASGSTVRNLIMPVLYGIHIKNVAAGGYDPSNCRVK